MQMFNTCKWIFSWTQSKKGAVQKKDFKSWIVTKTTPSSEKKRQVDKCVNEAVMKLFSSKIRKFKLKDQFI